MDVSIIIATKDRASWLPTCLTHLEQQTFPAARFEVIVADCGSTDGTPSVLERFASGSPVRMRPLVYAGVSFAVARNQAAAEAEGQLLLFLADDELASPRLLQNHVEAHNANSEPCVVIGTVTRHPQLPADSVTRLLLRETPDPNRRSEAPGFLDWPDSNISMTKNLFDESDGFSENGDFLPLEHLELAYRLLRSGVQGLHVPDTRSYVWQPSHLDVERVHAYGSGYGLYHLLRETRSKTILQRFRLRRSRLEQFIASFSIAFYLRAVRRQEKENMLFVGTLYRRILGHDRSCGFEDACSGRARRPPVMEAALPIPAAVTLDRRPAVRR